MSMIEWPPRNYCNIFVHNQLDKTLRIYWGGDIWGGHQIQDITPGTNSPISSRNVRRQGADVIFRMNIKRPRIDGTEHDLAITDFGFSVPAIFDCPGTTLFFWGEADSLHSFGLMMRMFWGYPTRHGTFKLASIQLSDWLCEQYCP